MPELPEVEFGRKVAEGALVGRRIEKVTCANDEIVFEGAKPAVVRRGLKGRAVVGAHRWGKYLWLELDRGPHPVLHFGMTGAFRVPEGDPLDLEGVRKRPDEAWPPRFTKLHLWTDDGNELAFVNARRLGRVRFVKSPRDEAPLAGLGFDPLLEMPRLPRFRELFARRKSVLKGLLLDQSFAAGVGNWIADEVLYQARLDPRRKTTTLSDDEVAALHGALKKVIRKAVAVDARKDAFPRTWLFHHRWGKQENAKTANGEPIAHITVAGRTTAWVPRRQK